MDKEIEAHEGTLQYSRLPECCVRMVELKAGEPDAPITAKLSVVCLEANDETTYPYRALSYTWGSDERVFPMILNDKPIKITRKLGDLFQKSRASFEGSGIASWWVDQLCIDQNDPEDKAQQIPKMRAIYEKAMDVIIWLDLDPGNDTLAFNLINRLARLQAPEAGVLLEKLPLSQILGPLDDDNIRSWTAFGQLMNDAYWGRTWILPEATARLDKCGVYGGTIDNGYRLNSLFWAMAILRQLRTRKTPPEYGLEFIGSDPVARVHIFSQLRTSAEHKQIDLFELLFITRRQNATKAEDKIYSMLPFATDVGDFVKNEFLEPSYIRGCERTYTDLIKWYILKHRNLNFLGYCTAVRPWVHQIAGFVLPSWIPDWTHNSYYKPFHKYLDPRLPIEDRIPLYKACGSFSYSIDITEPPSVDERPVSLFLSGLYIATVQKILPPVPDASFWEADVERSWLSEFDHDARYTITGKSCLDAFERTIVADVAFNEAGTCFRRPGRVKWWHTGTDSSEDDTSWNDVVKNATIDRNLFFARSSPLSPGTRETEGSSPFVMGLGRSDMKVGDQIWALKGGQVLYVLRRHPSDGTESSYNGKHLRESDPMSCPSLLRLNAKSDPHDVLTSGSVYEFVGECYIHGLMDGEALDIASKQPEDRPILLKDMSSDFEDIIIGRASRSSEDSAESDIEEN